MANDQSMQYPPPPPAPPAGQFVTDPATGQRHFVPEAQKSKPRGGIAIAALICGLLSVLSCWLPVVNLFIACPLGVIALVLGACAFRWKKAWFGVALGIAGIIASIAINASWASDVSDSVDCINNAQTSAQIDNC